MTHFVDFNSKFNDFTLTGTRIGYVRSHQQMILYFLLFSGLSSNFFFCFFTDTNLNNIFTFGFCTVNCSANDLYGLVSVKNLCEVNDKWKILCKSIVFSHPWQK